MGGRDKFLALAASYLSRFRLSQAGVNDASSGADCDRQGRAWSRISRCFCGY